MALNPELLRTRAGEIRQCLKLLRETSALTLEEFLGDADARDASLYRLLTAIESAQAICNHLAANIPTRVPVSLPDCFVALSETGVVPEELCGRLTRMARFRNLLVHRYWELDYRQTLSTMRNDLGDLEAYLECVGRHVGHEL